MALDQEASGANRGVVDRVSCLRFDDLNEQPDHFAGGVEFSALFSGTVCEVFDEVFVSCPEQIGELEIVVPKHKLGLIEVIEEVLPLLVRDFCLPLDGIEIDIVLQNTIKVVVLVLNGGKCLIEHIAYVGFQILEGGYLIAIFVRPWLIPSGT